MGHYAVLVPAYTGHVNPMLVLARALGRRGHRVTVLAPGDVEPKARRAGLEFVAIARSEYPPGEWARLTAHAGGLMGLTATRAAARMLALLARGVQRELPEIAARERLDGLVMDQIAVGAEGVCEVLKLPLAVACNALAMHIESRVPPVLSAWRFRPTLLRRMRNTVAQFNINLTGLPVAWEVGPYRWRHRLPRIRYNHINELHPSLVQVAQQPATFDFPRQHLPDHVHYTAPWVEDSTEEGSFAWERLDGRPLIYASLGTIQNQLTPLFQLIAEACAGLDAQLVLALGRAGATLPADLPGNPIVVDYAPQLAFVRRAALVITHGGLNTTLETLRAGVPIVALPISNDQPGVAVRVHELGAGEFILARNATAAKLRTLVQRVLNTPRYRERAQQWANDWRSIDGPAMAAELIERAFVTRQRVVRTRDVPRPAAV
jgi:zeaxanthin glucosyltransferase